ncbi:RnfABCDGE type electron transport complex subunit D [Thiomicrospira sp. WB1]|uniref:RnfABCDGE type electron transport complex subunit D n=1 Tax=Thiomicrospira sp. WB1 TaxID=1685380 RepID=UPI000748D3E9|nr:RnfABCDGE type electron transport complex subunit D [Thiomicrospira sp. WB1]KUJ72182.1 electron transport complex subunit D [Thiomicrospira sp. WB1]
MSLPYSSPYVHNASSVRRTMLQVQIAAFPALMAHIYFFGFGITIQWGLAVITWLLVEYGLLKLRNRPVKPFISDMSGLITVTGIVFCIPPESPWWVIVSAVIFALVFGKHLYGGLGYNPFNPAMLGYAFVLISFPAEVTQWTLPTGISGHHLSFLESAQIIFTGQFPPGLMHLTGATPLNELQTALINGASAAETWASSRFNDPNLVNGWFWVNVAFLIGGLWMLYSRAIRWQYPAGFLGALALMAAIFHAIDPDTYAPVSFHLFSGGVMLAAFFIITDPVSSSTTPMGRLIYAIGIGVLVYVIRNWGSFPDGIAFAVLLMNLFVPLLDQYTQPRVMGHTRR